MDLFLSIIGYFIPSIFVRLPKPVNWYVMNHQKIKIKIFDDFILYWFIFY